MTNRAINGVVLGLFPLLNIYSFGLPYLSIGQFLLFVLLIRDTFRFGLSKKDIFFKPFLIYAFFISIAGCFISWVEPGDVFHDILSMILFCVFLFPAFRFVDYDVFIRTIKIFGLICLSFFFIQFVLLKVGVSISGIIPFLPLKEADTASLIAKQMESTRASAFFMEPAHYSQFMVLVLLFFLFLEDRNKKNFFISILITISLLLSESSTGYALFTLMWGVWSLEFVKNSRNKLIVIGLVVAVLSAVVVFILSNENFAESFGRYRELNSDTAGSSVHGYSTHIRMVRGYFPFIESDFWEKLFGHGLGSHNSYVDTHQTSLFFLLTDKIPHYINSFQYLLFSVGIIGSLLYYSQMFKLYINTSRIGKVCVIGLCLLFLSADFFYISFIWLYVIIMEMRGKRISAKHPKMIERQTRNNLIYG